VILAPVGCALRRIELAAHEIETIEQREGRWVLADLEGKVRRIRTLATPIRVKQGINAWMTASGIEDGLLFRSISKSGKVNRETLSDWAVWSVVEQQSSKQVGIEHFGAHDLRRTCAKLCRKQGGRFRADLNSCPATPRSIRPNAISDPSRRSRLRSR
jgi:integrase